MSRRWDWEKGRDPHSTIEDISFSPDGQRLAAAVFRRNEVRIFDLAGNGQLQFNHDSVYGLDFAPDGKTLATAGWDKKIRLWDPATGRLVQQTTLEVPGRDTRLYGVRYSPDGRVLATADMNSQVCLWDAKMLLLKGLFQIDSSFTYNALAFSPDGLRLATGDNAGQVRVWDARTGAKLWAGGSHGGNIYTVGFGRDSRTLLAGGNGLGYLWDVRPKGLPRKRICRTLEGLDGRRRRAADRAFWGLTDRPEETIKLFSKNVDVRPAAPVDAARVQHLIGELDDAKFAKCETAENELAKSAAALKST